jgi:hypothetical protein
MSARQSQGLQEMNELISLLVKQRPTSKKARTSIAWLKERISQHYAMANVIETEKG